jgi:hypothetical protein
VAPVVRLEVLVHLARAVQVWLVSQELPVVPVE